MASWEKYNRENRRSADTPLSHPKNLAKDYSGSALTAGALSIPSQPPRSALSLEFRSIIRCKRGSQAPMPLRSKTKRLYLMRPAASSAIREQTEGALLSTLIRERWFTNIGLSSRSLYCSDACRTADSLAHSPACPPSTGSHAVTKAHHRGDTTQDGLFYQDIPELDIGGSLVFSTSARGNRSRSSVGKSLSSTAASSQSSSPISAPSLADEEGSIPQSSDLVTPKTPYDVLSPRKHAGHCNRIPPFAALEATISPSLRPVLRYSRRAYSTNVRAPDMARVKHLRTPSGNLLEMTRPPPESAPNSAATSPILLPHTQTASTMDTSTIQSRKKNRRSLPLSFATLTVHDANDLIPSTRGLQDALAPQFLLKPALASSFMSGGHHHHHKSIITPSHILGGHPPDWHPQLYSNSNSNHSSGAESGSRTNVDGSSSEGKERVTSSGTIKRPAHLKSKLAGNVKHDGHLGRLISPSAAVTPISTPSIVSVSGSVTSTLMDHPPPGTFPNATRAFGQPQPQRQPHNHSRPSPKYHALSEANRDTSKGRGRSPRRSSSAGTRNVTDRLYQPTFSSSSRSSASPERPASRGRSRLSMKENEPATTPVNHRLGGPTNQNGATSPIRRRASTPAQWHNSTVKTSRKLRGADSSRSPSLSTVSSSRSASCSSSANEIRLTQPMRVRRQTDGHPQLYAEREYARERLESGGERRARGRSRVPPEARLLVLQSDERRGRSLLR